MSTTSTVRIHLIPVIVIIGIGFLVALATEAANLPSSRNYQPELVIDSLGKKKDSLINANKQTVPSTWTKHQLDSLYKHLRVWALPDTTSLDLDSLLNLVRRNENVRIPYIAPYMLFRDSAFVLAGDSCIQITGILGVSDSVPDTLVFTNRCTPPLDCYAPRTFPIFARDSILDTTWVAVTTCDTLCEYASLKTRDSSWVKFTYVEIQEMLSCISYMSSPGYSYAFLRGNSDSSYTLNTQDYTNGFPSYSNPTGFRKIPILGIYACRFNPATGLDRGIAGEMTITEWSWLPIDCSIFDAFPPRPPGKLNKNLPFDTARVILTNCVTDTVPRFEWKTKDTYLRDTTMIVDTCNHCMKPLILQIGHRVERSETIARIDTIKIPITDTVTVCVGPDSAYYTEKGLRSYWVLDSAMVLSPNGRYVILDSSFFQHSTIGFWKPSGYNSFLEMILDHSIKGDGGPSFPVCVEWIDYPKTLKLSYNIYDVIDASSGLVDCTNRRPTSCSVTCDSCLYWDLDHFYKLEQTQLFDYSTFEDEPTEEWDGWSDLQTSLAVSTACLDTTYRKFYRCQFEEYDVRTFKSWSCQQLVVKSDTCWDDPEGEMPIPRIRDIQYYMPAATCPDICRLDTIVVGYRDSLVSRTETRRWIEVEYDPPTVTWIDSCAKCDPSIIADGQKRSLCDPITIVSECDPQPYWVGNVLVIPCKDVSDKADQEDVDGKYIKLKSELTEKMDLSDSSRFVNKTSPESIAGNKTFVGNTIFDFTTTVNSSKNLYFGNYNYMYGAANGKFDFWNTAPRTDGLVKFELTNLGYFLWKTNGIYNIILQNGKTLIGDPGSAAVGDSILKIQGGLEVTGGGLFLGQIQIPSAFGRPLADSLNAVNRNYVETFVKKTINDTISKSFYDDLVMPLTSGKQGALDKPDFDPTRVAYLFPDNDSTESIYLIVQLPHSYLEGDSLWPHLHWRQTSSAPVTWSMHYVWFNLGEPALTIESGVKLRTLDGIYPYTSGEIHQMSSFPAISGSGKKISSILLIQLFRSVMTGDPSGDVAAYQLDLHYRKNMTPGSRQEGVK